MIMTDSSRTTPPVNPFGATGPSARPRPESWAILTLVASFTIHVAVACARVFWLRSADLRTAHVIWCVAFVVVMTAVHLVGYLLWKRQPASPPKKTIASREPTSLWSRSLPDGPVWVVALVIVLLVFYSMIM